jgi:hypothetical protein
VEGRLQAEAPFYYLLIASCTSWGRIPSAPSGTFYYLLIASVVCSSWGLLYGFPCSAPSLSLGGEHSLSVSV